MSETFDVRIYKTWVYNGATKKTYWVRWKVGGEPFREPFATAPLADGFRSKLVTASRAGEPFDAATGRPSCWARLADKQETAAMSWHQFACSYADMKWSDQAATSRRGRAEALVAVTMALLKPQARVDDAVATRSVLTHWSFNTRRRENDRMPDDIQRIFTWLDKNTRPVADLADVEAFRRLLSAIEKRLDGRPAAASVTAKRRRVLYNALEYAVEKRLLLVNPLKGVKRKGTKKSSGQVDKRTVVNPVQARSLLLAVHDTKRSGPRLVAFFGLLYFSGLRPEEAADVHDTDLELPAHGWGTVYLASAAPHAGSRWTDDGEQREHRALKHRDVGDKRPVPCPPELVALLHWHLREFGTADDGRLFQGEFSDELPKLTYMRAWRNARRIAFTEEIAASPLGATPYTLRHACLSFWLNSGVPAAQVAEWAGHSPEMLLHVYYHCIDSSQTEAQRRIQAALGDGGGTSTLGHVLDTDTRRRPSTAVHSQTDAAPATRWPGRSSAQVKANNGRSEPRCPRQCLSSGHRSQLSRVIVHTRKAEGCRRWGWRSWS